MLTQIDSWYSFSKQDTFFPPYTLVLLLLCIWIVFKTDIKKSLDDSEYKLKANIYRMYESICMEIVCKANVGFYGGFGFFLCVLEWRSSDGSVMFNYVMHL